MLGFVEKYTNRFKGPKKKALRPSIARPTAQVGAMEKRLLYLSAALLGFGLLMIYSSSAVLAYSEGRSTFHYFLLQIVWILLGLIAAFVVYRIPLESISRTSALTLGITIFLLILVLFIGKNLNGARRWIDLGPFDLQPSEFAKLGFIIYISAWLSRKRPSFRTFKEVFERHLYYELLPFMLLLGVICVLIVLEPDLDTAVIIAGTALAVYYASGKDALHTLGSIMIVFTSAVVGVFAALAADYRVGRIQTYLNFLFTGVIDDPRDKGFQVWNGLIAVGSGGLFGIGFGNSRQKLFYLQNAAFTDSIFSVIAEEFGLLGSLLIIIAFIYFMALGVEIAQKASDKFSALLALGITTWISLQAFLNIGANLALIPFGGIPLPFISYGGSNTIMAMVGVGLLLNISRHSKR
jgi:cell division protein FtsW